MSGRIHARAQEVGFACEPRSGRRTVRESCPRCDATDAATLIDDGEHEWARCACGVVFKRLEPEGGASDVATLGDGDAAAFERYGRRRRRRIAKSRRQILDALEVAPRGRVLDVGCSLGYALEAAHALGLAAAGVDVSLHAIAECRRRAFDVHTGRLEALPFPDGRFGIVVLKHVFEHTSEPRLALAELRRVLAPGGAMFLAVPNLDYRRAVVHPDRSRFFRGRAGREHAVYWSPVTLPGLLVDEGFRVASVHPRLVHRRAGSVRAALEAAIAPLRIPLRIAADRLHLRKEFWVVAVRP